ncbi:MAG: DUF86 domain-containing protein [Bryobacterales bacterium]|nr:DUF86 domain-containing protein [Bryobacterales bacterium]
MNESDLTRLLDMRDAAREALDFVAGRSRGDLSTDRMLLLALCKSIEIIGEAASRVSSETRAIAPGIPWTEVVGMRNRLIHGYSQVNHDIVWNTTVKALPPLIEALEAVVRKG